MASHQRVAVLAAGPALCAPPARLSERDGRSGRSATGVCVRPRHGRRPGWSRRMRSAEADGHLTRTSSGMRSRRAGALAIRRRPRRVARGRRRSTSRLARIALFQDSMSCAGERRAEFEVGARTDHSTSPPRWTNWGRPSCQGELVRPDRSSRKHWASTTGAGAVGGP